jgi:hypothetical protein
MGQPKGNAKHCLEFANGLARDMASTLFGNAPDVAPYTIDGDTLKFGDSEYKILNQPGFIMLVTVKGSTIPGTSFVRLD